MIAESDHALAQEGGGRDRDAIEVQIDGLRLGRRTRGGDQLPEELTASLHAAEHCLVTGQIKDRQLHFSILIEFSEDGEDAFCCQGSPILFPSFPHIGRGRRAGPA